MLAYENFDGPHVWDSKEKLPQGVQKIGLLTPAKPWYAKTQPCPKQGCNRGTPFASFHVSRICRTKPADFFSILLELVERLTLQDSEGFSCV